MPPELDLNRVGDFGTGVAAVRMAMTGNPGLHSQQPFFFSGALPIDSTTLTFWPSLKAMTDFAYGPGIRSHQMSRQQAQPMTDRISSTRYTISAAKAPATAPIQVSHASNPSRDGSHWSTHARKKGSS